MLEILSARNTQSTVSGINYRKYLHQWICLPDMQMYVQARKVNEQLSDVSTTGVPCCRRVRPSLPSFIFPLRPPQIFYKDDLNWLKGIGCYAWDTPEILRVKQAGKLQSEVSVFSVSSPVSLRFLLGWSLLLPVFIRTRVFLLVFFILEPVQG